MTVVVGAWVALMAIGALVATGRALGSVSELECMAENMAAPNGARRGGARDDGRATGRSEVLRTRNDLYDALDGAKHVRAAWLELLPPAVELAYLAERAAHHAMRLAPAAGSEATMRDVIAHLGTVLSQCGASEADGFVAPEEAAADLRAIRDLQRRLEELSAHRERALAERGLSVINGARR